MDCLICGRKMVKDGFRTGRQSWLCKNCNKHQIDPAQHRKIGRPEGTIKDHRCKLCENKHYAKGFCQKHYRQQHRQQKQANAESGQAKD